MKFTLASVLLAASAASVLAGPVDQNALAARNDHEDGRMADSTVPQGKNYGKKGCTPGWQHTTQHHTKKPCKNLPHLGDGDHKSCKKHPNHSFCKHGNKPCKKPHHSTPPPNHNHPHPKPHCDSSYEETQTDFETVAKSGVYSGKKVGAAANGGKSYLTYGIVHSIKGCMEACDKVAGCHYFNVYQALYPKGEEPKDLSETAQQQYIKGNLTCALFSKCLDDSHYDNYGGQNDPSYIIDSYGFCKSESCSKTN